MAKKVKEPKNPKELKKELMDALIASRPAPVEVVKLDGAVTSEDDSIYLDWEQTDNEVRISGYVKVVNGDAQFELPVATNKESSFSGIAKCIESHIFRIRMQDGVVIYRAIGSHSLTDCDYLFVNGRYEIN